MQTVCKNRVNLAVIRAVTETMERRTLLSTGTVSGTVYNDYNGTGTNLSSDPGESGQVVYADLNNSGSYVPADPSVTTDNNGDYVLTGVPQGPAVIRVQLQSVEQGMQRESYPALGAGQHVTVGTVPITGVNFAVTNTNYVAGSVFDDLNGDGKRESNEPGLANVGLYIGDGFSGGTGPAAVTASDGTFAITGLADYSGNLDIQPLPAGYRQTLPAGNADIQIPYGAGEVLTGLTFGLAPTTSAKLTGKIVATSGSYANSGNTAAKAFDGNFSTYFDAPTPSGAYAGLDFGSSKIINQISFAPRNGYANRMVGGVFQGSNSATFSTGVTTLYTITTAPVVGKLTTVPIAEYSDYRYVRYVGPTSGYCDVAEIQFYGTSAVGSAFVQSSTLYINGSTGTDNIFVYANLGDQDLSGDVVISTSVNGIQQSFDPSLLHAIVMNTYAGNDNVNVNLYTETELAPFPVSIIAGDGNDTFTTDFQDDYYEGNGSGLLNIAAGKGNDSFDIEGSNASATVVAGNGNDEFDTNVEGSDAISSVITAGNGNDTLNAGSSGGAGGQGVQFTAGTGRDQLFNSDEDDYVYGTIAGETFSLSDQDEILVGSVYSDANGDGLYEPGESLVADAPVSLQNSFDGTFGAITDSTGGYNLDVNPNPDSNEQTFGGPFPIDLSEGFLYSGVDIPMRPKLTGSVIGTSGSYLNDGNTIAKAFDGNLSTYFDGPTNSGDYAGLNLGSSIAITGISYAPRIGWAGRMVGGVFQASSSPNFSGAVTLYTITTSPAAGVLNYVPVTAPQNYQYVRYVAPNGSFGDVAELQFYTTKPPATGAVLGKDGLLTITGTSGADKIHLNVNYPETGKQVITTTVNGIVQTFNAAALTGIVINSGDGNDTITVDGSYAINDSVLGGDPSYTLATVINTGNGNDVINTSVYSTSDGGDSPSDTINLGSGNDGVTVDQDDDSLINCGAGTDTITATAPDFSSLSVNGGSGDDIIYGGNNTLFSISGGTGIKTFYAGPPFFGGASDQYALNSPNFDVQNFFYSANNESITVTGSDDAGRIQITGMNDNVTINGGNANDLIYVANAATADIVTGNGNNSVYVAVSGSATVTGGAGNDTIDASDSAGPVTIDGGGGTNTAFTQSDDIVTNIQIVNPQIGDILTGSLLATAGSYLGGGNTAANAFDGNLFTYFNGPTANGDFAGLDLGTYQRINQIAYAPRPGFESRMVGGVFEASDSPDFSNPTILYTITAAPVAGQLTTINLTDVTYARYIRYLAPDGTFGNVAEIQFIS